MKVMKYGQLLFLTNDRDMISDIIISPILEEFLFRGFIYYITNDFIYAKEFNAIIFSFAHIINSFIDNTGKYSKLLVINQSVMVLFLGYYLVSLDNIYYAIIMHIVFNTLVSIQYPYIVQYFKRRNAKRFWESFRKEWSKTKEETN